MHEFSCLAFALLVVLILKMLLGPHLGDGIDKTITLLSYFQEERGLDVDITMKKWERSSLVVKLMMCNMQIKG